VSSARTSLRELALLFLRLGLTAFGGPAAHIALIEEEVVKRRKWLTEQRFLDLLGAANLIPGPTSTELAIHIGWERRRAAGLVVAGVAFIVPAMAITTVLAWAYVRYGNVPAVFGLLYGIKPVMLAIVVQAVWGLASRGITGLRLRVLAALSAGAAALGVNELVVLFGAGLASLALRPGSKAAQRSLPALSSFSSLAPAAVVSAAVQAVTLPSLFWVFFKTGSVLFGSGYVLLAFLRADLVERLGWLTEKQLLDAIAVGQVTPGPVFTTATFIGYLLAGPSGALVATAGIFLPAFVFVALSGPLIPRLRQSPSASAFLDGVNAASLALMAVVTVQLGRAALVDWPTLLLGALTAFALLRFRTSSTWLILAGALLGLSLHVLGGSR
jgi:chromate transporter